MKKYIFLFLLFGFSHVILCAQKKDSIYTQVEKMPEFPNGEAGLNYFLGQNLTYPETAKRNNIQGKVWATFIVNKQGKISHVEILTGIGGGCDEEVIRVIKKMPKWSPGYHHGKPVIVKFTFPIKFTLR